MDKIKLKIIVGSTRQGRFSEKPANWLLEETKKNAEVEPELLDLRDYPMPFFDEAETPSMKRAPYQNETVKKWTAKISEADAFIVVTPEYNHGYPAVLKNALDYAYGEWNKKPVGFLSYGGVGGARVIEQLRQVVVELQMVAIRGSINIPREIYMAAISPEATSAVFAPLQKPLEGFSEQLLWWAKTLKAARAGS